MQVKFDLSDGRSFAVNYLDLGIDICQGLDLDALVFEGGNCIGEYDKDENRYYPTQFIHDSKTGVTIHTGFVWKTGTDKNNLAVYTVFDPVSNTSEDFIGEEIAGTNRYILIKWL
jgi:hypothetical protein